MLAVNQTVLHIVADCIRSDVKATLRAHANEITEEWTSLKFALSGHQYRAIRVPGSNLDVDPFVILANQMPSARADMGKQTLVVTGAPNVGGGPPSFIVLNNHVSLDSGDRAAGEELLDANCSPK